MDQQSWDGMIEYDPKDCLGQDGSTHVFRGTIAGSTIVAVKTVRGYRYSTTHRDEACLLELRHPHVIRIYSAEFEGFSRLYSMELCLGTMAQLFLPDTDPLKYTQPIPSKQEGLLQLTKGLGYMHFKGLAHRNIKPSNVLITTLSPDHPTPVFKWSDFGLTRVSAEEGRYFISDREREAENWMGPEVLRVRMANIELMNDERMEGPIIEPYWHDVTKESTIENDLFVAGILYFFFLLDGRHPFGDDFETIKNNILNVDPVNFPALPVTHFAHEIIKKMLEKKPISRMTMREVLYRLPVDIRQTQLMDLCSKENPNQQELDEFNQLVSDPNANIDLNWADLNGLTPLLLLCRNNISQSLAGCLETLLTKGLEFGMPIAIDHRDRDGRNAILNLFRFNWNSPVMIDVLNLLSRYRIDFKVTEPATGFTALHLLVTEGIMRPDVVEVARFLIRADVQPRTRCKNSGTALQYLRKYCSLRARPEDVAQLRQLLVHHPAPDDGRGFRYVFDYLFRFCCGCRVRSIRQSYFRL